MKRVLGVIPARGGSKGIPRKNLRLLAGRPLLAYTVDAARGARLLSRTILSTDDPEIAALGRACGIEVPFLRPPELATDAAATLGVVQHAVIELEADAGDPFDAVCLLQPTSPLRRSEEIDACIRLLFESDADGVVSVLPVPVEYNPHWVYFAGADGVLRLSTGEPTPIPRRQDLPPAFHRDGAVYVTRRTVLMNQGSLYGARVIGYATDPGRSVNIDTLADLERAERLLQELS